MRNLTAGIVAGLLLCAGSAYAQNQQTPSKARAATPEIPYDAINFTAKMPQGLYMGEGVGVATDSKGNVFVMTRSGETRVFEFDHSGKFLKEFGAGSYAYAFAHQVIVDHDDNIWTVDEGTNVILKYNQAGKLLMVLGKRPDPLDQLLHMPGGAPYSGANRPYSFHRPTDVTWDAQGNIFVSDGYTDSRIVKYDKNGRFIKSMGTRGNGTNQFNTPHGIAADAQGNIYVADRGNGRIVVLDNDLNWKTVYDSYGNPWDVCISQTSPQYLFTSNSTGPNMEMVNTSVTGEIYKLNLDGTAVGRFGKGGKAVGEFASAHSLECRNNNEIYVSELTSWRVQRVTLKGAPQTSQSKLGGQP